MHNSSRHVENVTLVQEATPILLTSLLEVCREVLAWLNVKKHRLFGWSIEVPILSAFDLKQERINIIIVWCKTLLFRLAFLHFIGSLRIWRDVNIGTSVVLE